MRPLEIALALSCLPALVMTTVGARLHGTFGGMALFLPAGVFLLCAATEGLRIHLAPVYGVAGVLALFGLASFYSKTPPTGSLGVVAALVGLGCLALGGAVGWLFPVFSLPPLPGQHAVGTMIVSLPGINGNLEVQLWYPTVPNASGAKSNYLPREASISGWLSNVRLVHTRATLGACIATGTWPVILSSPSWDGARYENSVLSEALASEGFVIVALDRPKNEPDPAPPDFSTAESAERFRQSADHELTIRTADMLCAFEALAKLQSGALAQGAFQGRLDLDAVGVMGYSFGGAVAAEACRRQPRLRSGMDLDGVLFGEAARSGATQPFLFITDMEDMPPDSELRSSDPAVRRNAEFSAASLGDMDRWLRSHGGWWVQLADVQHADFCDRPLFSRLRRFTGAGPRDPREVLASINRYAAAFFQETLRGRSTMEATKNLPRAEFRYLPRK